MESKAKHSDLKRKCDVNGSLELIKGLVYSTDDSQEPVLKMANSMVTLHCTRQNGESTAQRFISQVEVTESEFGKLIPTKYKGEPSEQQEKARKAHLARLFILGLNKSHKQSVSDLGTAYINKQNDYPETPEAALRWATEQLEACRGTTAEPPPTRLIGRALLFDNVQAVP